jgi:hypothetical protein
MAVLAPVYHSRAKRITERPIRMIWNKLFLGKAALGLPCLDIFLITTQHNKNSFSTAIKMAPEEKQNSIS